MRKILSLFVAALFCATMFADTKTIYCKMTQSWWTEASAAIAVHYWGRPSGNTEFPGIRMTAVAGEDGLWMYDIPTDVTGFCFVRVNPTGDIADWHSKTIDLSLQDDKNLFTITSNTEHWYENKCEGEWSAFVPAKFFITGDSALVVDAGFDKSIAWNPAAIKSTSDSYTLTNLKANQTYKLLVTVDGTWNTKRQFDNLTDIAGGLFMDWERHICFRLATAGDVTVTYTNSEFTLSGEFAAPTVGIVGNFEGNTTWALQTGYTMTPALDKKSASVTFTISTTADYQMKVSEDGVFYTKFGSGDLYIIQETWTDIPSVDVNTSDNNMKLKATKTGSYTFKWTFATHNLVVTYPTTPTAIDNTDANTKAVKRIVNGQLVIEKNGVRYNALGIEVK